jgi:DNA helicase-2/ATP-dependent DNA helicase PcrA
VDFTKAQLQAIRSVDQNTQIVACAGSGKTEVVARRVVELLRPNRKKRVLPRNIIAFTFTEKAAAELKDRITTRCLEAYGQIPGLAEMYVGTIHAYCLELLKSEVPQFLKYEVLNEVQQVLLTDRNSKKSGLTNSKTLDGRDLRRYVDTGRYLSALGILREAELNPRKLKGCSVAEGLSAYEALLHEKRYLDYTAIMAEAAHVLERDKGVRDRLAGRVLHVIVDEYQDVNPVQERIVRALHGLGARLCVVGDDDQTLYQWRGSSVQHILGFVNRYEAVKQIRLEENHRSSRGVVETARDFIAQNGERLPKAMIATDAQPFEQGDIAALTFANPEAEAEYIVQTIKSLLGVAIADRGETRGISFSDCAILFRSVRSNADPVIGALRKANIPFIISGMNSLFSTPEALAARELFYFIAGRCDEKTLRAAWVEADVGATGATLRAALAGAKEARDRLTEPAQERWSFYSIQRVYLQFIEALGVREETVPNTRGEVLFYNLGKFSQLISDFENIHFHSSPDQKYVSFADFLQYGAEDAYPEGWQDNQYASPDAVRIMTVHQAKGMEWPVVFVPALLRNRFPAAKIGGASVWNLIPQDAVRDQGRYEGGIEDERRLFYVAMTRSQKFLFMTWAPIPGKNNRYARASEFWDAVLASKYVKRKAVDWISRPHTVPRPRASVANVVLTFSDMKYFLECPYQFKLRVLYGFNAPIHEALGYGKSLHDALADVHGRALRGEAPLPGEADALMRTHLHTPFAYPSLRAKLEESATRVLAGYIEKHQADFDKIEFFEKPVTITIGGGVSVSGRIDLVRRLDTDEVSIVDFKSNDRSQREGVTDLQLHTYALGYQELTGRRSDFVDVYHLDEATLKRRSVDDDLIDDVRGHVTRTATALRDGKFSATPERLKCEGCDYVRMCSAGSALTSISPKAKARRN